MPGAMKIEKFRDKGHRWRWRMKGGNGETLCNSEAYSSKAKCEKTMSRLASRFSLTIVGPIEKKNRVK